MPAIRDANLERHSANANSIMPYWQSPTHAATAYPRSMLSFTLIWVAVFAFACGAGTADPTAEVPAASETDLVPIGDDPDLSAHTRPNSTFSYDQFVEAGWKQYQVYEVDTLPEAEAARYGFFERRDIEIRRYPDNESALRAGTESAEEAIDRTVHDGSGFASRRIYGAYLIAGNVVMMCEIQVADCLALIEAVEQR